MGDLESKDLILGDMAEAQKRQGKEPTTRRNEELIVPVFERIDRKPKAPETTPVASNHSKAQERANARAAETGRHAPTLVDEPGVKTIYLQQAEAMEMKAIAQRIELLLTKKETGPLGQASWSQKVESMLLMAWEAHTTPIQRRHVMIELCNESSETFGDWKTETASPLYFHAKN